MISRLTFNALYSVFALFTFAGIVLHVFFYYKLQQLFLFTPSPKSLLVHADVFVFAIGVVGMFLLKALSFKRASEFRMRRLQNIQILASILLLASAALMFLYPVRNYWAIALLVSALFELVVIFRMPKNNA